MDGVILIDKPEGMTSFSLANRVKRLTGAKKSGHAGTLDPLATGVMAVMLGNATKLSEYLTSEDKRYTATIRFGLSSDTMDSEGEIIAERECNFTKEMLLSAMGKFLGRITQVPPKYSAIKVNGRKLYSYARAGQEVEIPSREVEIYVFDLISFDEEKYEAVVDVFCSKGTYIRSLINDLGEMLGCGGIMTALRRTKSGDFEIENCITLSMLEEGGEEVISRIIPCDEVISHMPRADVSESDKKAFTNGNPIPVGSVAFCGEGELYRVYCEGVFYAVGRTEEGYLKIVKMIKVTG
ncbi:MAG: tRNA pseudouridine(55) synthase TruB [Eubacteriaceae bacterium]|nr:tRNA pseudouridine(55) synthase TruB [Eubacteriaceae bacterium]